MFKAPKDAIIAEIIRITGTIPRFVDTKDIETLNELVTLGEIEAILKWFKREKILKPDGWPMEFYLTFFEHIGANILMSIKDCRISR